MIQQIKVAAFMTAPRYEAVFARNCIDRAFKEAGIPLNISGGVFYGQCMQRMLNDALDKGIEYAITVDFDSMFTARDVERLLAHIVRRDDIDAIAAMQSRRGGTKPLFTIAGQTMVETDGSPFQVTTAHFGLTVLKADKLRSTPKPWFYAQPTESGEWEKDKSIDDDIWFWRQWKKAGNTVWVDPECRIGHMEEMVSEYDDELGHRFTHLNDWYKNAYESPTS